MKHQLHSASFMACSLPSEGRIRLVSILLATMTAGEREAAYVAADKIDLTDPYAFPPAVRHAIARGKRRDTADAQRKREAKERLKAVAK